MSISIERFSRQFLKRSERLRNEFLFTTKSSGGNFQAAYSAKYTVISLLDCWADFNRSIVLQSALGGINTASGAIIPRTTYGDLQAALIVVTTSRTGQRTQEPRWHDANQCIAAAKKLSVGNYSTISSAISAATSPADQIRLVRNFFAHEKSDCASKILAANWFDKSMDLSPWGITKWVRKDGRMNFEFWIDELQVIASAAVQ